MALNRNASMKYRTLGKTGMDVSVLSFGASSLGSVFRSTDDNESIQIVHRAIAAGINYIDTAPWYGHGKSEMLLGKALESVARDKYYISTKVGRYHPEPRRMFDFSAERTLQSIDESLQRLGLDYVDIIQVHDMEFAPSLDIIINETLPALEKAKKSGKVKFIGITGYPLENFRAVIDRSSVQIDTILTYCHYSMNDSSLVEYLPYFQERGIGVINASPISMGLLSDKGPPQRHHADQQVRRACTQAAEYCKAAGVDISKLAMHFSLREPSIPTTLFSTASLANLEKNLLSVNDVLNEKEEQIMNDVMEKFLRPLNNRTWEGIEVAQYREALTNLC